MNTHTPKYIVEPETLTDGSVVYNVVHAHLSQAVAHPATEREARHVAMMLSCGNTLIAARVVPQFVNTVSNDDLFLLIRAIDEAVSPIADLAAKAILGGEDCGTALRQIESMVRGCS